MPISLVQELKVLSEKNHYMDLSEQIRQIIRKKCSQHTQPYKHEVQKMREGLELNLQSKKELEDKQKLVSELTKIIEGLKK